MVVREWGVFEAFLYMRSGTIARTALYIRNFWKLGDFWSLIC